MRSAHVNVNALIDKMEKPERTAIAAMCDDATKGRERSALSVGHTAAIRALLVPVGSTIVACMLGVPEAAPGLANEILTASRDNALDRKALAVVSRGAGNPGLPKKEAKESGSEQQAENARLRQENSELRAEGSRLRAQVAPPPTGGADQRGLLPIPSRRALRKDRTVRRLGGGGDGGSMYNFHGQDADGRGRKRSRSVQGGANRGAGGGRATNATCFLCQQPGHLARYCPSREQ